MPEWQVFYSFAFESNHSHRVGIIYGGNKLIWLTFCVWSTKQKGVCILIYIEVNILPYRYSIYDYILFLPYRVPIRLSIDKQRR